MAEDPHRDAVARHDGSAPGFACALDAGEDARFERFRARPLPGSQVGDGHPMIVNSLPKSGSVWMCAMLRHLFGLSREGNPAILHVGDIRDTEVRRPVFGVVVLVRDLRDVVVSWYRETQRNDLRAGFAQPRYPTVEAFYFEFLLGFLRGEPRFEHGRLSDWLDLVTFRGFPLIRYEDLVGDPQAGLRKVMTFWKVEVSDGDIAATAAALEFDRMPATARTMGGTIAEAVAGGHLDTGRTGRWTDEMPDRVAADIDRRFGDFQGRLGYG